jgi:hypothetical protein
MKTSVFFTLDLEGFHCWPEAMQIEPKAGFLAQRHRHMFHFKCYAYVTHTDRDIEFILAKRKLKRFLEARYLENETLEFGRMSCEDIALEILRNFEPGSVYRVEVSEDRENGAIVEK